MSGMSKYALLVVSNVIAIDDSLKEFLKRIYQLLHRFASQL